MKKIIFMLIILSSLISCKNILKESLKSALKKDFIIKKINDKKQFEFHSGALIYNEFEIEIINLSGVNITRAFSTSFGGSSIFGTKYYTKIEVQVGEAEAEIIWQELGDFFPKVSEKNPWRNGETRTLKFKKPYNPLFKMTIGKYAIRDYEIKEVNLKIGLKASNSVLDYYFDDYIKEIDLKNELIEFSKTIK